MKIIFGGIYLVFVQLHHGVQRRPAIVIHPIEHLSEDEILIVPVSSRTREDNVLPVPNDRDVPGAGLMTGLMRHSFAVCNEPRLVSRRSLVVHIGTVAPAFVRKVQLAVQAGIADRKNRIHDSKTWLECGPSTRKCSTTRTVAYGD